MTTNDKPTVDVSGSTPTTDSDYECEKCNRTWNVDEWDKDEERSWGGRSGGSTYYQCPTEDCNGLAVVHW